MVTWVTLDGKLDWRSSIKEFDQGRSQVKPALVKKAMPSTAERRTVKWSLIAWVAFSPLVAPTPELPKTRNGPDRSEIHDFAISNTAGMAIAAAMTRIISIFSA
jgi:hypothetical protein